MPDPCSHPELPLQSSPPDRLQADRAALLHHLHAAPTWRHSKAICAALHWTPRRLRDTVQHLGGQVISDPARGYRLTAHATPPEVRHALASLRSRARHLLARYLATQKHAHSLISPPPKNR